MEPNVALPALAGVMFLVGALVSRIPVRCPHVLRCEACESAAERERLQQGRLYAEMDHRWHVDAVTGCRRCIVEREP